MQVFAEKVLQLLRTPTPEQDIRDCSQWSEVERLPVDRKQRVEELLCANIRNKLNLSNCERYKALAMKREFDRCKGCENSGDGSDTSSLHSSDESNE